MQSHRAMPSHHATSHHAANAVTRRRGVQRTHDDDNDGYLTADEWKLFALEVGGAEGGAAGQCWLSSAPCVGCAGAHEPVPNSGVFGNASAHARLLSCVNAFSVDRVCWACLRPAV